MKGRRSDPSTEIAEELKKSRDDLDDLKGRLAAMKRSRSRSIRVFVLAALAWARFKLRW
jgi:hypothetical protein